MGENHSNSKRAFWKQFTKEEKSAIFSARAKKMWASKTPAERKARSLLMVEAKQKKLSTT